MIMDRSYVSINSLLAAISTTFKQGGSESRNVFEETDLVLKRTHILLLTLNSPCSLALLDLQTLGDLEEVGHVGVFPAQQDAPVLGGQAVQVDKVGDDVVYEEGVTGSLQGLPTVDIKRG